MAFGCVASLALAQPLRLDQTLGAADAHAPPPAEEAAPPLALKWAPGLGAGRLPPAQAAAPRVPLIATVRVNEQDKGEQAMLLEGEDEFLVPREALARWVPGLADAPATEVDGEPHVRLRSLPGVRVRFDEAKLALRIDVPPESFAVQSIRYQASDRPAPLGVDRPSAILNYQVGASGPSHGNGATSVTGTVEAAVRWREWLLRGSAYESRTGNDATTGRGLTYLAREDPFKLTRLTIGDFQTGLDELGGGLVLGGIAFARALDLDPYTVRQPGATYRTLVDVPSTVDVYVGDTRILRQAVGPGPVELGNLTYLAGRRDVRVVVRDVFGREQDVSFPFYFADRGLAPGVQDYRYGVGAVRRDLSSVSGDYGELAFSAFHRAGLTDALTAGFQAEGTKSVVVGGPSATVRTDRFGIFSLAALLSRDREAGDTGTAAGLDYSFQSGRWSAGASMRWADRAFRPVGSAIAAAPPLRDLAASFSWTSGGWGTITATWREVRPRDEPATRGPSLAYSLAIARDWQLQAQWRRNRGPVPFDEAVVSLQYVTRDWLGRAALRREDDRRIASVQVGSFQPEGEGFGFTLDAEDVRAPDGNQRRFAPDFTWNTRYATLQGQLAETSGDAAGRQGLYQLSLSGSLATVAGEVGLSRLVDDSFAVVRIEPPVAGVRVYLNQQFMGRTDSAGRAFLPRVVSSIQNAVSIDDRDIPIDRSLDRKVALLVPWSRSGALVTFQAPVTRSVSGVASHRSAGDWRPLEYAILRIAGPAGEIEAPTGRGGEFYLENLPAGDYPAAVELEGRRCEFTLAIPASDEMQLRMPEVRTCALH